MSTTYVLANALGVSQNTRSGEFCYSFFGRWRSTGRPSVMEEPFPTQPVRDATHVKSPPDVKTSPEREFHFEEYKQLRSELAASMTRLENLMRLALIAVAGVFSWLLVQGFGVAAGGGWCLKLPYKILLVGWILPVVFVFLAGLAARAVSTRGTEVAEYIRTELEPQLATGGRAYETFLHPKPGILWKTGTAFWVTLFVATVIGATTAGIVAHPYDKPEKVCVKS